MVCLPCIGSGCCNRIWLAACYYSLFLDATRSVAPFALDLAAVQASARHIGQTCRISDVLNFGGSGLGAMVMIYVGCT